MTRKELIDGVFSAGQVLARRLLHARRRIVADTLLYSLVIFGIGCIIPTPLDPQQSQPNFAPVLVVSLADPQFGPITHTQNDPFALKIGVDDPDDNLPTTQDKLHARLFFLSSDMKTMSPASNEDLTLAPAATTTDPTLYEGTFVGEPLCVGRSGVYYLFVVVADRPFISPTSSQVVAGGGSDSNYWVLTCT